MAAWPSSSPSTSFTATTTPGSTSGARALRGRAEAELGPGGLEAFDGRTHSAGDLAAALATLSFATGTRYLLADEVGAWKAPDLAPLTDALARAPPGHGARC